MYGRGMSEREEWVMKVRKKKKGGGEVAKMSTGECRGDRGTKVDDKKGE